MELLYLEAMKKVILIFSWCQPCKMLAPRLKAAMETVGDTVDFAKVDIDELTDIAMEYGVIIFFFYAKSFLRHPRNYCVHIELTL